jgi:hypothetical protein
MNKFSLLITIAFSLVSGSARADAIYSSRTGSPISSKLLLGASVEVFVSGEPSGYEITSDVAGVIATPAVPVRIHTRDTVQVSFEHSGGRRSKKVQILLHADTGERVFGAWTIEEAGTTAMRDSYAYRPSDTV